MIKPTVGRVVLFQHQGIMRGLTTLDPAQPMAATIAFVHNDRLVNLAGVDHAGETFQHSAVELLQDDAQPPIGQIYCEWMPYQKGQAIKHEAIVAGRPDAIASGN